MTTNNMSAHLRYLDYNASAPLLPEVWDRMQAVLQTGGNASSIHGPGRAARAAIETARGQVAALVNAAPTAVIFTAGATEANNMVLQAFRGTRIFTSAIEHPSVLEAAPHAEQLPVTRDGIIDEAAFLHALENGPAPALISIMTVNNETGVIQPVGRLAKLAKKIHPSIYIHTDAVQAAGRIPLDFPAWHLDYMSLSAHKIGGPQGAGALITAPGAQPTKLLHGGGQERRQRAGTENVGAIAGFGLAAEIAGRGIQEFGKLSRLRDHLISSLRSSFPLLQIHGEHAPRVANTLLFSVPGHPAQTQLMALDLAGFAVSSGSACSSGSIQPSHVLLAMGVSQEQAADAIRVSFGLDTPLETLDSFAQVWSEIIRRRRNK